MAFALETLAGVVLGLITGCCAVLDSAGALGTACVGELGPACVEEVGTAGVGDVATAGVGDVGTACDTGEEDGLVSGLDCASTAGAAFTGVEDDSAGAAAATGVCGVCCAGV